MRLFSRGLSAHEISPREAHDLLATGDAVLIDVREGWEWQGGHASPARHVPLASLPGYLNKLPTAAPVFVICASGKRSLSAARFLSQMGYEAKSVAGGTAAWARERLPLSR